MSCKNWKIFKIKEFCSFSQGIQIPIVKQEMNPFPNSVQFIRIVDFSKEDNKDIRYIKDPGKKYLVSEDDLVMIRYGSQTAGKIARGFKGAIANNIFKVIPDENIVTKNFLYYFLLQVSVYDYFRSSQVSTTMPAITFDLVGNLEIKIPPLSIQSRISSILSTLDEKIELNRQINQTLEEIAQAIYKGWFVDFNFPNEEGKPYHDSGDEMQGSELGLIPKGWRIVNIGKLFKFVIGGDWGKEVQEDEYSNLCAIIRGTDLNNVSNGQIEEVPKRYIKTASFLKRELKEGDIVFEISGGSKEQATGRNILITNEILRLFSEKLIPASFCRLIRTENIETSVFLSTYLRLLYDKGGTWDYQLQSTGISNFQFSDFENREKLVIPNNSVLEQFKDIIYPFYKLIGKNNKQIILLTQIRNHLLPKLMSGEIEL